ncbi:MAG: PKD domain-containing protein, partial [Methanobacteriota archaeon]
AATGAVRWTWSLDAAQQIANTTLLPATPCSLGVPQSCRASSAITVADWLAVTGPYVIFNTVTIGGKGAIYAEVWVLDRETGLLLWTEQGEALPRATNPNRCHAGRADLSCAAFAATARPTGTPTVLYLKNDAALRAKNPEDGTDIWTAELGREDTGAGFGFQTAGLALAPEALYANSLQSLYRFPIDGTERPAPFTLAPDSHEYWEQSDLTVTPNALYGHAYSDSTGEILYAFDREIQGVSWRHEFGLGAGRNGSWSDYSVGDGVIIATPRTNNAFNDFREVDVSIHFTVLGRTAASLTTEATVSDAFPGPGAPVTVDLSRSRPGLFGPGTRYRVEWGDGTVSDWQADPRFQHAYNVTGDHIARLQVGNDAGQTASTLVTFHVGGTASTLLSTAFDADHQNTTFFVLGLVMTGVVGVVGVARVQRRRRILQRELAAIDVVYEKNESNAPACEAALAERRTHVGALLAGGRLDESQYAALTRRIDDLARALRIKVLDDRFDFLPLGMVKTLQGILEDGHITRWEHEHFLWALERDRLLSTEQKQTVRGLIDSWFERDSGGRA